MKYILLLFFVNSFISKVQSQPINYFEGRLIQRHDYQSNELNIDSQIQVTNATFWVNKFFNFCSGLS